MTERTEARIQAILEKYVDPDKKHPGLLASIGEQIREEVEREEPVGRLLKFHRRMNQHVGEKLELPPSNVIDLRLNLVIEEFSETVKAMGSEAYSDYGRKLYKKSEEVRYEVEKLREKLVYDPIALRDGFADTQVVLTGTAISFGLHVNNVADEDFAEVMDSNDSKACKTLEEAEATQKFYREEKGENSTIDEHNGTYLVLRVPDRKLLKSINYKPANFKEYGVQNIELPNGPGN